MQKDFHYYCIGVLARAAGFPKEDALTIAYASQYADNSTESEPIRIGDLMFDPVRTAHIGLKAFDWSTQKRVYIPFHFIPPKPIRSPKDTFVTGPNSSFALDIFKEACKEEDELRRLCRIGLALHTLADTWAHQGFSGREHKQNDVEKIYHRKRNKWKHLLLENFYLDFLPQIGHAQAGNFPDQPFLEWKYSGSIPKKEIKRHNLKLFMDSAEAIYNLLRDVDKKKSDAPIPWEDIEAKIHELLADPEEDDEKRCNKWKKRFQYLFNPLKFEYDKRKWRDEALNPHNKADTEWDDFKPSDFRKLQFPLIPGFYESLWVQFHRAALRQRHYVLENLL